MANAAESHAGVSDTGGESPGANAPTPWPPGPDMRQHKYKRDALLDIGKGQQEYWSKKLPDSMDLSHEELKDLDKRAPYTRPPFAYPSSRESGSDIPSLKPSWATGRFGQSSFKGAAEQSGVTKAPPGFGSIPQGMPIRSRLVDDGVMGDELPQRAGGAMRNGLGGGGNWRTDTEHRESRSGSQWSSLGSPPERSFGDAAAKATSPGDASRHRDRWGDTKPGPEPWRGSRESSGAFQAGVKDERKDGWRNSSDRWGNSDDRMARRTEEPRRTGDRWVDSERDGDRRPYVERRDATSAWDDDGSRARAGGGGGGARGGGRAMTAAEIEEERLAFRKQMEVEVKPGVYEHEEVDLEELMDDEQRAAKQDDEQRVAKQDTTTDHAATPSHVTSSGATAPPPGFSAPLQGKAYDDLVKEASQVGEESDTLPDNPRAESAPPRNGFAAPGLAHTMQHQLQAGTQPTSSGQVPLPALSGSTPVGGAAASVLADAGQGRGSMDGFARIPASVLSAFGEGSKEAYGPFPGLSSIWGAPAGASNSSSNAQQPLMQQQSAPPVQQHQAAQQRPQQRPDGASQVLHAQHHHQQQQHQGGDPTAAASVLFEQLQRQQAAGQASGTLPQQVQAQNLLALLQRAGMQGAAQQGQPRPNTMSSAHGSHDSLSSMLSDLGLSPDAVRSREHAQQMQWQQQQQQQHTRHAPSPQPGQGMMGGAVGAPPSAPPQLSNRGLQELLSAAASGNLRPEQQANLHQLQRMLVAQQQQQQQQRILMQQQQQQEQQRQQQHALHMGQPPNLLMQMQGLRVPSQGAAPQQQSQLPGQHQQQQQPAGNYSGMPNMQMQQQLFLMQMQRQQQLQQMQMQAAQAAAAAQQAHAQHAQAQQQQMHRPPGGFDPALLARLQAIGYAPGAAAGGALPGSMGAPAGGNQMAAGLALQQVMHMHQLQQAAALGAGGGSAGSVSADQHADMARLFSAMQQQQQAHAQQRQQQ